MSFLGGIGLHPSVDVFWRANCWQAVLHRHHMAHCPGQVLCWQKEKSSQKRGSKQESGRNPSQPLLSVALDFSFYFFFSFNHSVPCWKRVLTLVVLCSMVAEKTNDADRCLLFWKRTAMGLNASGLWHSGEHLVWEPESSLLAMTPTAFIPAWAAALSWR